MNTITTYLKRTITVTTLSLAAVGLVACYNSGTTMTGDRMAAVKKDGDIALPADYIKWPKFVSTIDKDSGHVREIYINPKGYEAKEGSVFPYGTVSVMAIYFAKKDGMGKVVKDKNGRLVKANLEKVFVMEKGVGWGKAQSEGTIDNGDWLYAAYKPDGTPATSDFTGCRECHLPLAGDDYMARYDEHFDYKAKMKSMLK